MRDFLAWVGGLMCGLWVLRFAFYLVERWERKRGRTNGFGIQ